MSLIVIGNNDGAVLVDKTTGYPLPMLMFEATEHAEHFLDWLDGQPEDALGPGRYYDSSFIADTVARWRDECLDTNGYIKESAV